MASALGRLRATPGISALFVADHAEATRRGTLYLCLLTAGFSALYLGVDFLIFPARVGPLASARMIFCAFALLMYAVLRLYPQLGRSLGASLNLVLVTSVMVSALVLMTGGLASPYYVAYNLLIFSVAALLPWPVWLLSGSAAAMMLMYVVAVLGVRNTTIDSAVLLGNLHFILISAIAGGIALKLKHRLIAAEFASRRELTETAAGQLRFFRVLSHELRAPVTALAGAVELMRDPDPGMPVEQLTEAMHLNSERLLNLLNGFLDFARLETGQMPARFEVLRTGTLMHEVCEAMQPLLFRKQLTVTTEDAELLVRSDPMLLRQLLTNLLANATKFTHQGSIRMRCKRLSNLELELMLSEYWPLQARSTIEPPEGWLCFEVSDSGIGIRGSDLDLLSLDFNQLNSPAAGYGGTGLGLAISRRIAQLLSGMIAVQSAWGKGSTFAAIIPYEAASQPSRGAASVTSEEQPAELPASLSH